MSTFFDPRLPNPQWSPWFPIHPEQTNMAALVTVSSVPGGVSLFAANGNGEVMSTFFDLRQAQPEWVPWFLIHAEEHAVGGLTAVSSVSGGISLFIVDQDGVVKSTFFDPRLPNPQWSPWFPIHPEQTFMQKISAT